MEEIEMPYGLKMSRPHGCISSRQELLDLIIECRKEKKAMRLWEVCQMGNMSEIFLTSKSRIIPPDEKGLGSYSKVPCWKRHGFNGKRFYKTDFLPASYHIFESNFDEEHALFTNKRLATGYSDRLKNDPAYVAAVKRHWADCDRLFRHVY
jgi:hypothetical protein